MSSGSIEQASNIQADYMKLLITQLQNQNPLEPLSNEEMASQLAQFSQLQQLETMNSSFSKVLETTEREYARSLIGKNVSFVGSGGDGDVYSGKVERVYNNVDGEIILTVGSENIRLEDIVSIGE